MSVSAYKTCRRCNYTKPLEAFSPHRRCRMGRASWCRDCVNETQRDSRMQTCSKCGKTKYASDFPLNAGRKNGLNNWCKSCNQNRLRHPGYRTEQLEYCARCERPAAECVFPISLTQFRPRSSWCIRCHEEFRQTLAPHQAAAEAKRWEVPVA